MDQLVLKSIALYNTREKISVLEQPIYQKSLIQPLKDDSELSENIILPDISLLTDHNEISGIPFKLEPISNIIGHRSFSPLNGEKDPRPP